MKIQKSIVTIAVILFFTCTFSSPLLAETNDTIMVRRSDLPAELVKELEARQSLALMAQRIETYGKWVGVGKEVGVAVNDSLSAITEQADNFSKTGVGKFTLFLVAWKVLGKDFVGVIIGVPLLIVWTTIFAVFWRRLYCVRRICTGFNDNGKKQYELDEPKIEGEERVFATAVLCIGYAVASVWTIAGMILR